MSDWVEYLIILILIFAVAIILEKLTERETE